MNIIILNYLFLKISATNYMAWYHRRKCIDNLESDINLNNELDFLDSIMEYNQKNYQIWHHRKVVVEKSQIYIKEKEILNQIFKDEPKNFHAWCHRIWAVRKFNLIEDELKWVEDMIERVKNLLN
jgi:protein farnesyltransferase/geranylgeranyltransferase type-1 subunit alpha